MLAKLLPVVKRGLLTRKNPSAAISRQKARLLLQYAAVLRLSPRLLRGYAMGRVL